MGLRDVTAAITCCVVLVVAAGCSSDDDAPSSDPVPSEVEITWDAVDLPMPPGAPGRIALRDAVRCADTWYVAGGVFTSAELSRPALWSSRDGARWQSVPVAPRDYWARRSVLSSVACRDGSVAVLGAKSGGAHGNPRVSSWYQRADGVLVDVVAGYTLYGGADAVNVAGIEAGRDGWLIAGNRVSGAAVWLSGDATEFTLLDDDPALANDDEHRFLALHQVADGERWTVVGSASVRGRVARVPQAWTSSDAGRTWSRESVPTADGFSDLERVVLAGDRHLAVGLRGERFGVWWRDADATWTAGASFGTLDPDRTAAPSVSGLTVSESGSGTTYLAAVSDGRGYQLWTSSDGEEWRPATTPPAPATGADRVLTVASDDTSALLVLDDEAGAQLWRADLTS